MTFSQNFSQITRCARRAFTAFYFIFFHYVMWIHYCNLTVSQTPLEYWIWITWLRSRQCYCGIDNVLRATFIQQSQSKNGARRSTPEITFGYFTKLTRIFWIILPGCETMFSFRVSTRSSPQRGTRCQLLSTVKSFDHDAVMETFHRQHGNGFRCINLYSFWASHAFHEMAQSMLFTLFCLHILSKIFTLIIFSGGGGGGHSQPNICFCLTQPKISKCSRTFSRAIWPCLRGEQVDASVDMFGPTKMELLSVFFLYSVFVNTTTNATPRHSGSTLFRCHFHPLEVTATIFVGGKGCFVRK